VLAGGFGGGYFCNRPAAKAGLFPEPRAPTQRRGFYFLDQVDVETVSYLYDGAAVFRHNRSSAGPANGRRSQALWQPRFGICRVASNSRFKPCRKIIAPINDAPAQLAVEGPIGA
jgi:hypothetical protein